MEQLPSLGTAIADILVPTTKIYSELLKSNAQAIHSTPRQTYRYGPTDRHELDVYQPICKTATTNPILIFIHGGGFVAGDKLLQTVPDNLAYANIGHFFASNYNYTVVIANYRLLRHGTKFPSGGEDISMVLDWISTHAVELNSDIASKQPRDVFIMGSSAGGVHTATYLLAPAFEQHRRKILPVNQQESGESPSSSIRLKKAVLLHTPCAFDQMPEYRRETITAYYDSKWHENCVNGLLRQIVQNTPNGLAGLLPGVDLMCLVGTLDPEDEVLNPVTEFINIWRSARENNKKELKTGTLVGHNHLSPVYAPGTGIEAEESWARKLVDEFLAV